MPMLRLFVAVPLGSEVGSAVARAIGSARLASPQANWVAPEAVHLTLVFLGAVDEARLPVLSAVLAHAALRHRPFCLEVGSAGTFGRGARPRVLWGGVQGDLDALRALQRDVAASLVTLGFPPEAREYRPHLTLARARDAAGDSSLTRAAERLATFEAGRTRVTHVVLVHSQLGPRGARYTTLAEAALDGVVATDG